MLVKRIIPSISVQDGRGAKGVQVVRLRDRNNARRRHDVRYDVGRPRRDAYALAAAVYASRGVGTLGYIDEGLSEGDVGALGVSIFLDGTFSVADAHNFLAERGLTERPAPRMLQPREMS